MGPSSHCKRTNSVIPERMVAGSETEEREDCAILGSFSFCILGSVPFSSHYVSLSLSGWLCSGLGGSSQRPRAGLLRSKNSEFLQALSNNSVRCGLHAYCIFKISACINYCYFASAFSPALSEEFSLGAISLPLVLLSPVAERDFSISFCRHVRHLIPPFLPPHLSTHLEEPCSHLETILIWKISFNILFFETQAM